MPVAAEVAEVVLVVVVAMVNHVAISQLHVAPAPVAVVLVQDVSPLEVVALRVVFAGSV